MQNIAIHFLDNFIFNVSLEQINILFDNSPPHPPFYILK